MNDFMSFFVGFYIGFFVIFFLLSIIMIILALIFENDIISIAQWLCILISEINTVFLNKLLSDCITVDTPLKNIDIIIRIDFILIIITNWMTWIFSTFSINFV